MWMHAGAERFLLEVDNAYFATLRNQAARPVARI